MKRALIITFALFYCIIVFPQTANSPQLTEIVKPVTGASAPENMVFSFESAAAWGDYNNDGFLDLITSGVGHNSVNATVLYKNNGNDTFTKVEHPFLALRSSTVTWLDYNNDGNLDLFLTGMDDIGTYSGLFKNLGPANNYQFEEVFEGLFEPLSNGGGNRGNRYVTAGDYNNDGWVDLYMQGKNEEGIHSILYKNEEGLSFSLVRCPVNGNQSFVPLYENTATFGDYNNDGFLDILAAGRSNLPGGGSTTAYYKNNGDGTFSEPVFVDGGVNGEVAWCDYNNDGLLDFLVTGYSFSIGWQADLFENKGDNTFTKILPSKSKLATTQDCSIAWGDVNNDGFEDVLFLYSHPNALFLNNSGNQTFKKQSLFYSGSKTYDQTGGMVCLVDFDRDNDLDLFTMGNGGNNLPGLFRNNLSNNIPENNPPSVPAQLKATKEGESITFSWDASTDDHTPTPAINYNLFIKKDGSDKVISVLPADLNTGLLKVNETLAPITSTSYKLHNLEDGVYTFGVQAIDNGKLTSRFATERITIGGNSIQTTDIPEIHIYKQGDTWTVSSGGINWDKINIYDIRGIKIKSLQEKRSEATFSNFTPGLYIVKIEMNNKSIIKKIVL